MRMLLLAMALMLDAPLKPIRVILWSPLAFAPATIHLTVRIPPHEANRTWWAATVDHEGPIVASGQTMDGEESAGSYEIWWKSAVPAGDYDVLARVCVVRNIERCRQGYAIRGEDRRRLQVIGR